MRAIFSHKWKQDGEKKHIMDIFKIITENDREYVI